MELESVALFFGEGRALVEIWCPQQCVALVVISRPLASTVSKTYRQSRLLGSGCREGQMAKLFVLLLLRSGRHDGTWLPFSKQASPRVKLPMQKCWVDAGYGEEVLSEEYGRSVSTVSYSRDQTFRSLLLPLHGLSDPWWVARMRVARFGMMTSESTLPSSHTGTGIDKLSRRRRLLSLGCNDSVYTCDTTTGDESHTERMRVDKWWRQACGKHAPRIGRCHGWK
jgi:hypothetical protein